MDNEMLISAVQHHPLLWVTAGAALMLLSLFFKHYGMKTYFLDLGTKWR
jgi:hypothetical protein